MAEFSRSQNRISSIDILRGIIMVVMALDHVRDYFHTSAFVFDPTDLSKTHTALFLTRWITHFCAPGFVLLAGVSIYLSLKRKSKSELSIFLLKRGLWLIILELVVMRFAFFFNFYYDVTILGVFWMIGACMMCMAAIIHLSDRAALILGIVIVLFGQAIGQLAVDPSSIFFGPWMILMQRGFLQLSPTVALITPYPIVPWLGIMILGYSLGKIYNDSIDSKTRKRLLTRLGVITVTLFILLRFLNFYGDPSPWSVQGNFVFTVLSFFNCTKYPITLLFTLMTLGPLLLMLAWLEDKEPTLMRPFHIFGRVPQFYFIGHFFLIHISALILFMNKTGKSFSEIDLHFSKSFGGITPEGGYTLPGVYLVWITVVLVMYPLCNLFDHYKSTHRQWWLSYL